MDEKYSEQILDYINGRLTPAQHQTFENELNKNATLAKEVALYKDLYEVQEVIGDEELKAAIEAAEEDLEEEDFFKKTATELAAELEGQVESKEAVVREIKGRSIWLRPLLSIAANLLLFFAIGTWWSNNNYNNHSLANNHFAETEMSRFVRGNGQVAEDNFAEGLKAMDIKDYGGATEFFENITEDNPAYNEARLYLALSQFKAGDYTNAKNNAKLVANQSQQFAPKAQWLLVNTMLANNETDLKFQALLEKIASDAAHPFYQKKAKNLQRQLASVWRNFVF